MKARASTKGFTLIELLIVVAIIAILAAIAVPNFLEAQVRSKISKVKADMRSIKTAMEAYYVDWNNYCHDDARTWGMILAGHLPLGYPELTTPIAYFSGGYIRDPFIRHDRATVPGPIETDILEIGTGDTTHDSASGMNTSNDDDNARPTRDCYVLNSCGPDLDDDSQAHSYPHRGNPNNLQATYRYYDPTNGTVSRGDIYKFGGVSTWLSQHPLTPADAR